MVRVNNNTLTETTTKDNTQTECPKASASTTGQITAHSAETSNKVTETVMVYGENHHLHNNRIKDNTSTIRNADMVCIIGRMVGTIKVILKMMSGMVLESCIIKVEDWSIEDFGRMVNKFKEKLMLNKRYIIMHLEVYKSIGMTLGYYHKAIRCI